MGSGLQAVDLLKPKDVRIQEPDRLREPIEIHPLVGERPAMQDVERGHAHGKKVLIISTIESAAGSTTEETGLRSALKQSASALKADGVPFALGGGYALWVAVRQSRSTTSTWWFPKRTCRQPWILCPRHGFRIDRPPEDWLFKAYLDDDLVDVLHRLAGVPVERSLIATATEREILGVRIPVLPPTPIMIAKLQSLSEHYADFAALLPSVRAVREQLDWQAIIPAVEGHPFADAFLFLVDRLGIADTGISESEPSSGQEQAD